MIRRFWKDKRNACLVSLELLVLGGIFSPWLILAALVPIGWVLLEKKTVQTNQLRTIPEETREKIIKEAIVLWEKEVGNRSMWCGLNEEDYLDMIDNSYIESKDNEILSAISVINRSYIFQNEKVEVFVFHRLVAKQRFGQYVIKLISDICKDNRYQYNVSSANDSAYKIYKLFKFKSVSRTQFQHIYVINPFLLIIILFIGLIRILINLVLMLIFLKDRIIKSQIKNLKVMLSKYIELRRKIDIYNKNNLHIDWDCNILRKYLIQIIKNSRLLIYEDKIESESILMNIKYNNIRRTMVILDSTYEKRKANLIIKKFIPWLTAQCLLKFTPRVLITSESEVPPINNPLYIHIKANPSSNLIYNNLNGYRIYTDQDTRSLLFGDSFL